MNRDLQSLTEELSLQFFHRPFEHRCEYNSRLKTIGGRYLLKTGNIEINPKILTILGEEILCKVIKHELCHYHLHQQGQNFQHRSKEFKQLLNKVDGIRYVDWEEKRPQTIRIYQCQSCQTLFKRRRKMNCHKYVCGRCRGKIFLLKQE